MNIRESTSRQSSWWRKPIMVVVLALGLMVLAAYVVLLFDSEHSEKHDIPPEFAGLANSGRSWPQAFGDGTIMFGGWIIAGLNSLYVVSCGPTVAKRLDWELSTTIPTTMTQCNCMGAGLVLLNWLSCVFAAHAN